MNQSRWYTCIPILAILSCTPALQKGSPYKECLDSETIPESNVIDTVGITGTIEPSQNGSPDSNTAAPGRGGTWMPSKSDVYRAELILRANVARTFRCIDSNYTMFFRKYTGTGPGTTISIQGTRKSRDRYIGGYRSFWIDIGVGECCGFDALINIRTGECTVTVRNGE